MDRAVQNESMTMKKSGSFAATRTSSNACVKKGTTVYHYDIAFEVSNARLNKDGFLAIDNTEIDEWLYDRYTDRYEAIAATSCENMARDICGGIADYVRDRGAEPDWVSVTLKGSDGASMEVKKFFDTLSGFKIPSEKEAIELLTNLPNKGDFEKDIIDTYNRKRQLSVKDWYWTYRLLRENG